MSKVNTLSKAIVKPINALEEKIKGKNKEDIEIEANRSEKDISDDVKSKTSQENSLPVWDLSLYKDTPQVSNSISYNHNLKPTQQKPKQNDSIEDDGIEI